MYIYINVYIYIYIYYIHCIHTCYICITLYIHILYITYYMTCITLGEVFPAAAGVFFWQKVCLRFVDV